MRLEQLEISGFKSFAKRAVFDFSSPIVAIVGPNGSGKSNVAEAIKWVLGEQSLKELRSRQGSDLIFGGSAGERTLSSAKVSLVFDNSSSVSGFDFEKLIISREVWRDGLSEYFINNSAVRLKDILSLLAKIGLSGKKYLIINQGETDRILALSALERREAIEDALGLRIYHLKEKEALAKLERTEENISRAGILRGEIKPHLNFLEKQVKKFEKAAKLKEELKNLYKIYLIKEANYLKIKAKEISRRKEPINKGLGATEEKFENLNREFSKRIKEKENEKLKEFENELSNLHEERFAAERNLGKIEGFIELEKKRGEHQEEEFVPKEDLNIFLEELETFISSILEESVLDRVYEIAGEAMNLIRSFAQRTHASASSGSSVKVEELIEKKDSLIRAMEKIALREATLKAGIEKIRSEERKESETLKNLEKEILETKNSEMELKEQLNLIKLDEERFRLENENYLLEKESARNFFGDEISGEENFAGENERRELKKELEKLKFKAEENASYDESLLNEYQDVLSRDNFLERELLDLEQSRDNLNKVMLELKERLEVDFKNGFDKINEKLQELFGLMFEGGKARLCLAEDKGVDISVSLPRKKIKSLEALSGGERSLVSIALIFALIETNPPPFLVLDETDAALDEANSFRYGKILEAIAKRTRLVTITHNRQTMNKAGALYGVTMDRKGFSRILSLKLEQEPDIIKNYVEA